MKFLLKNIVFVLLNLVAITAINAQAYPSKNNTFGIWLNRVLPDSTSHVAASNGIPVGIVSLRDRVRPDMPAIIVDTVNKKLWVWSPKDSSWFSPSTDSATFATQYWSNNTFQPKGNYLLPSSLSSTSPLNYSSVSGNFSIQQANSSQNGYLNSSDWNTFNSKQNALGFTPEDASMKGEPNGYASLDVNGKVPTAQIPTALLGAMKYQGTYDASTGSYPTGATQGNYWVVSTAGTISSVAYKVGDWMAYNGSGWNKIDNQQTVTSVAGKVGAVTLTTDDITEGTNQFFTTTRARNSLSFTAGSGGYNSSTGVITIPTNTNQLSNGSGYITSYTETDPIYSASSWASTTNNSSNWNTAYSSRLSSLSLTNLIGSFNSNILTLNVDTTAGHIATKTNLSNYYLASNPSSFISGINSSMVTSALGYTPYNSTNPNGYTSNTGTVTSVGGTGSVSGLSLSGTVTTSGNLTLGGSISGLTTSNFSSSNISQWTNNLGYITSNGINGTGFVKASGTTLSYDSSTYLTTSSAASTYQPLENQRLSTTNNVIFNKISSGAYLTSAIPGDLTVNRGSGQGVIFMGDNSHFFSFDGTNYNLSTSNLNVTSITAGLFSGAGTRLTGTASNLSIGGTAAGLSSTLAVSSGGTGQTTLAGVQSWLGLGSNAYTSTAYLPLTGGTLTGALTGTSAIFSSTVNVAGYLTASGGAGTSDIRLKNIKEKNPSISILDSIDLIKYTFKNDPTNRIRYGNIAQQVEKIKPELVLTANDKMHTKSILYDDLQNLEIHELYTELKALKKEVEQLKAKLNEK